MYNKKSVKATKKEWAKIVMAAYERDGCKCQICHHWLFSIEFAAPHHIIPRGRLRLDIIENILTLCNRCHLKLHAGNLEVSVDDLIDKYKLRHYLKTEG